MGIDILKMDICCTIQLLNSAIDPKYNPMVDFDRLHKLTIAELEAERNQLIPKYNEECQKRKAPQV